MLTPLGPVRHEYMARRSLQIVSTQCEVRAVLQGNDVGQERSMTYREVLQEVCRLVRPSLLPPKLTECKRLLWHQCSAAVTQIAPIATALPKMPVFVKNAPWTVWVASCSVVTLPVPQANWLKSEGVRKGDAVAIYLPLICELPSARPPFPKQQ